MESIEVLNQFRGSEVMYEHNLADGSKLILTEGCFFVRGHFASYWLFDLIASYQYELLEEPIQFWKLVKFKDEAQITCDNGKGDILASQKIPFTDFPFDIIIWHMEGTCLLPSEY